MRKLLAVLTQIALALAIASPLTDLHDSLEPELIKFYDVQQGGSFEFNELATDNPQAAAATIDRMQNIVSSYQNELPDLSQAINEYLDQAKAAITFRNSAADLELRLWSIKGVLGKDLYKEAANLATQGNLEASQAAYQRFMLVTSRTVDLSDKAEPLILTGNGDALKLLSLRALAFASSQTFELAQDTDNTNQAFAMASKGYGLMLAGESSEWADRNTLNALADGLTTLASGEFNEFRRILDSIQTKAETFLASTEGIAEQNMSVAVAQLSAKQSASATSEPAAIPEEIPAPAELETAQEPDSIVPAESEIAEGSVPAETETDSEAMPTPVDSAEEPAAAEESVPAETETDSEAMPVANEEFVFAPPGTGGRLIAATLEEELAQLPQPQEVLDQLGLVLGAQGHDSVFSWLEQVSEVRGIIASGQSFSQTGDSESAQIYLEYALTRYNLQILPIVEIYNPDLAQRTHSLFNRMANAPAIRTSDIAVLVGELQEVEESLFGSTLGPGQSALVTIEMLTLGLPRAVVFILAGLLAILPIYLLEITFGRVSRYWRYVQYAFFFLLLPALLEAISYIGSLLATYGNLPALAFLSNFSILQNVGTQLLWGMLLLLVVVFSTIGWYGLAVQFGVLRERGTPTTTGDATNYDVTGTSSSQVTSSTTVEWDPEEDDF